MERKPYYFMMKSRATVQIPKVVCGFLGFFENDGQARKYINQRGYGHFEEVALIVGSPISWK